MLTIRRLPGLAFAIVGVTGLLFLTGRVEAQEPAGCAASFENGLEVKSEEGHISLKWGSPCEVAVFELQEATGPAFAEPSQVYVGGDKTTYISGLPDGEYYFRVRARSVDGDAWGGWSDTAVLTCQHHSLGSAFALFGGGGLLFLALVVFVCVNARHLDRFEGNHA